MTQRICLSLAALAAVLALSGCDSRSVNQGAVDSSNPELRQIWQTGLAASHANDYVRANTNFVSLLSRDISPNQLVAVQDALATLNERMHKAAAAGNADVQKALEVLKVSRACPKHPRP